MQICCGCSVQNETLFQLNFEKISLNNIYCEGRNRLIKEIIFYKMNPIKCRIETKQKQLCDKNEYELKTIQHGFVILLYKGNCELKQS